MVMLKKIISINDKKAAPFKLVSQNRYNRCNDSFRLEKPFSIKVCSALNILFPVVHTSSKRYIAFELSI